MPVQMFFDRPARLAAAVVRTKVATMGEWGVVPEVVESGAVCIEASISQW